MENSDDQFSLKWNNFQSNLATGFHDLLQEEDMVDVTLAAEGKILYAHKIILSVCSPYFKDLFKVNPCKHPIVILKDVGHQELADMLDFMYRGEASVRQEDLAAFLKLAETLKVKGLAGDKEESSSNPPPQSQRKSSSLVPKKKKIVETAVYEPEEDPGDPDFNPGSEVKKKRKRVSSPQPKTDITSTSATNNSFVPLANPKQEVHDQEEVEFLDDAANDPLVHFITGKQAKHEDGGQEFEDPNQEMTVDKSRGGFRQPRDRASRSACNPEGIRLNGKLHVIITGRKKDCKVCSYRNIPGGRRETTYYCDTCPDKPRLHLGDETHDGDMDMTAGPSNPDESTEQVPQEKEKCESTNLDFIKDVEPVLQMLIKKEDLVQMDVPPLPVQVPVPPTQPPSKPAARYKPDQFFQMSAPFSLKPSNFFSPGYPPRQRSQSSEFRPPHDFSNPIWEYFTLEEDKATCKVCGKRITYRNNAYVTNLVTHLRTRGIGHDTSYNFYMMKKSETSNKIRDEMALNYLLTNMASTVFGQNQNPGGPPTE